MKPIEIEIYVERVNDVKYRPYAFKVTHNTYNDHKICIFDTIIGPTETTGIILVNREIYDTFNPSAQFCYSDIYDFIYKDYKRVELL